MKPHDPHPGAEVPRTLKTGLAPAAACSRIHIHPLSQICGVNIRSDSAYRSDNLFPRHTGKNQIPMAHFNDFEIGSAESGHSDFYQHLALSGFRRGDINHAELSYLLNNYRFHLFLGCLTLLFPLFLFMSFRPFPGYIFDGQVKSRNLRFWQR
jgi:hypothetical protein